MDARKYTSKYIKPDNVREGPIETRILTIFEEEKYGRLALELETGSQFALNDGNVNLLIRAWGADTDRWIGLTIALELGEWTDWRADPPEKKETVRVRAISPAPDAASQNGSAPASRPLPPSLNAPKRSARDDMSDDIPFVWAFLITGAVAWLVGGGSNLIT